MSIVKTRMHAPKNNNRFLVTIKYTDGRDMPYHTITLKKYTDEALCEWIKTEQLLWANIGADIEIDRVMWICNEGFRYNVEGF